MRAKGADGMGRFSVDIQVANYGDLIRARDGTLPSDQVRRRTIRAVVDSGATRLVLPETVVKDLGLPFGDKVQVRYANHRTARRSTAEGVYVELLGRHGTFTAVVEPNRDTALLGAIVLEDFDLLADCPHERLLPRDPRIAVHEIE